MKYGKAMELIQKGEFKPYILFCGEEEYLKAMGVEIALKALNIEIPEMNLSLFEDRPEAVNVVRAAETLPLMSAKRAILIRNTDILSTTCSAEYTQPLVEMNLPKENVLIISTKGKPDKRKAFVKKIEKEGIVVECGPLEDWELAQWVVKIAGDHNLMISSTDVQMLIEFCGNELNTIVNEIGKLSSISCGQITRREIEKYVTKSMQYNVFQIHDYFCGGNIGHAKKLLEKLLTEDPNPIGFLSLIAGNFKQMLVARACLDAGYTEGKAVRNVMEESGAKEWAAKRALRNAKKFSVDKLRNGVKKLGEIDFNAKQGGNVLYTDLFALLFDIYMK